MSIDTQIPEAPGNYPDQYPLPFPRDDDGCWQVVCVILQTCLGGAWATNPKQSFEPTLDGETSFNKKNRTIL